MERSKTLFAFIGLRVLRIAPALCAEVFLSALILGPILTTHSLTDYFSSNDFRLYFLNILGDIHYLLPGVFREQPLSESRPTASFGQFHLNCNVTSPFLALPFLGSSAANPFC
jgi:hypothetical protein